MRDKNFILNSIKMDLHRIATASGDISKPLPIQSIKEFLEHAQNDFNKIETTPLEETLKNQLISLSKSLEDLKDLNKRLIWTEDILTIRCRMS